MLLIVIFNSFKKKVQFCYEIHYLILSEHNTIFPGF